MNNSGENIYRKCRKEAGLSTKEAAPLIGVQERTLRGYECFIYGSGGACPPEEVVLNMARAYGTLEVVYRHVSENTLLGRLLIPDVDFDENMALAYLKSIYGQENGLYRHWQCCKHYEGRWTARP
ncbi:MAG: helix-turn-helix domain-containing protein, partial [Eubacterium aggregans]